MIQFSAAIMLYDLLTIKDSIFATRTFFILLSKTAVDVFFTCTKLEH